MDIHGNVSADFVPKYDLCVYFKTMRIRVSKVILLEYADQTMQYSNLCVGVRSRCFCCQHDPWNYADSLLVIFDYFLLLPSTMYGISGLRSLSKKGKSSEAEIVINGICQFLFVFDVISAVYLYIRFRKT